MIVYFYTNLLPQSLHINVENKYDLEFSVNINIISLSVERVISSFAVSNL